MTSPAPAHKKHPVRRMEQEDSMRKAVDAENWRTMLGLLEAGLNPESTKSTFPLVFADGSSWKVVFTRVEVKK